MADNIMDTIELEQLRATISNLNAETAKYLAEAKKLDREARWYPAIAATAFLAAVAGVSKFLAG